MDLRNEHGIKLGRLWPTEHLRDKVEAGEIRGMVRVETKEDGHRVSLQIGGGEVHLVSRGKREARKGVAHAAGTEFVTMTPYPWMMRLANVFDRPVVLDAELCLPHGSEARLITSKGNEDDRVLRVFDCVWAGVNGGAIRRMAQPGRHAYTSVAVLMCRAVVGDKVQMVHGWTQRLDTVADIDALIERAKREGVEGWVVKRFDAPYGAKLGWKVKPSDPCDAVVIGWTKGKSHSMGTVTKSGNVGSVKVGMFDARGNMVPVGFVGIGPLAVPLAQASGLMGRVVEFKHRGFDPSGKVRSASFVGWREDKSADECVMGAR